MRIALAYTNEEAEVIERRGQASHEPYHLMLIARIRDALVQADHQPELMQADRHIIDRLVAWHESGKGEPGLVFNLSYGVQGHMRYTHLPGILEMLGLPYIGSDPLAQAIATDKLIAKRLFRDAGLPTPAFEEYQSTALPIRDMEVPAVVKPVGEAASEGVQFVENEEQLEHAVLADLREFHSAVLAEAFVPGRELNVSLLGNDPVEAFPPVEVIVKGDGPPIYDADSKHSRGREIDLRCPTDVPERVIAMAQELAKRAFAALRCRDWARVDLMYDEASGLQLIELNTIPAVGPHSSYICAAREAGYNGVSEVLDRLVSIAAKRSQEEQDERDHPHRQ